MATTYVDPYASLLPRTNQPEAGSTVVKETSPTSATESGNTSSFMSDITTNFSADNQKVLDTLLKQLIGGGTKEQKKTTKDRDAVTELIRNLLGEFSKQKAFEDAKGLMALNMQNSMQKNMPAIQRSIEGAGTSAASMQSLLSQNLVNDSALAASALGAEQAKAYGGTTTNLALLLEALTRQDNSVLNALTNALGIAKQGTVNRTTSQSGSSSKAGTTSGSTTTQTVNGGYQGSGSRNQSVSMTGGQSSGGGGQSYLGPNKQGTLDDIVSAAAGAGYDGDLRPYYPYEM